MLRLILASAVCVGLLSGCATTKELVNKVGSSDTPLAQVLKERPDLRNELATVEIRQYFNTVESPTAAEVKVTETGLLDDSVKSVRTVYNFKLVDGDWKELRRKPLTNVRAVKCSRTSKQRNVHNKSLICG